MNQKLKLLEDILKRNSEDPDSIDIENEIDHYFFFNAIHNKDDLEIAWSVFDEHEDIRNRLSKIQNNADSIPGWGYKTPNLDYVKCDDEELKRIVSLHVSSLRSILLEEDYNADIITFIDNGFKVEIAPSNIEIPGTSVNTLFGVLYEAITEYWIEYFPYDDEHYEVLKNWAIHLTKCDEVATYLMWPFLERSNDLTDNTMDAGAKLWKFGCRDRYWVKDLDYSSKVVYVRPPWLDK
ncbi:hypothetical protein [Pseudoalteromonas sp. TB64]|uniref:hypothetical protein n=1 Tax=Pseudoalteromonas sp. TB64 TaxID=1938600 RepID=UPI00040915D8|nr:hypothetical protein [Pseudoalteromonas sp. TB64]